MPQGSKQGPDGFPQGVLTLTGPVSLDDIGSLAVVRMQTDERFLFTSCPYFVDHGMPHAQNVTRIFGHLVEHLSPAHGLSDNELFLGACACYLHDVGMFHPQSRAPDETRRLHGTLSRQRIQEQKELFLLCGDETRLPWDLRPEEA